MGNLWIFFALGLCIGILINELSWHLKKTFGILRIDRSDPEIDRYLIDLDDIKDLSHKKWVLLKIDNDAHISRK